MNSPLRNKRLILSAKSKEMSEHFNPSLPRVTKSRCTAIVKWTFRATIKFTMTNGGAWQAKGEAIIVRRADVEHVHDYAQAHCKLRDFLLVRLPMKIGLRTTEICTLTIEDIDFDSRSFQVLDSKKKRMFPLPLDVLTLQFIKDLISDRIEGPVFMRETWKMRQNMPLTRGAVWHMIHKIGLEAGVKGFSPRLLRHYCIANLLYPKLDEHGNRPEAASIETVRRILRHTSLLTTTFYVSRLVFFEDMRRDYDRIQNPYVRERGFESPQLNRNGSFYEEFCSHCIHEPTCKFKEKMCSCQACSGCRFYKPKKKELIKHG